jgi:hypothetical protein
MQEKESASASAIVGKHDSTGRERAIAGINCRELLLS